jgi:hypothetical protein
MPFDDKNPWSAWLSRHFPGTFAHPDAPAGGSGYGYSRTPGPTTYTRGAPDPHSPVGLNITPREAAQGYAEYEFEQVRSGIRQAMSWAGLREMALRSLGPKSFALGACYGVVKNPAMSVAGLLQLQKMFIEADLYERLTRPMSWKTMLGASWGIGGPSLFELGELAMIKFHLMNVEMLKHSYEAREALIKEMGQIFTHPLDFFAKAKDQLKASYVEKWNQFCLLQKQTDLKSQFEAGELFGDVLMEVVMLVLTVISVGAGAAKLAAKVPQLVRVAEFIKGARAAEAGGAAEEAAEMGKGAGVAKKASTAERVIARDWEYAAKQSGRTEPGAVPKTPELAKTMKQAEARTAPVTPDGWPKMSDRTATTFGSEPKPVEYAPGTKLYRVIDSDESAAGSFWSTEPPPRTEGAWRAGSAVKDSWNGDGGYVEHTVGPEGLKAWAGPAAPQEAAVPEMVLPGGGQQAWVPPNTINPVNSPNPSPWNASAK